MSAEPTSPPLAPRASGGSSAIALDPLERRLQLGLLGRLTVATIVLGGTLFLWRGDEIGSFTPRALSALLAIAYALSGIEALVIRRPRGARERVGALHILVDLLLAAGVVSLTGGAESGLTLLFGAVILFAASVGGGRLALQTSGAAVLLYTILGLAFAQGWIDAPPDQPPSSYAPSAADLAEALLRNLVGLVVVGALAATLGDRIERTRTALAEAEASVVGYALLYEDIVRSLTSGLVTLDTEGRITTVNPAAAAILRAEARELRERPLSDFFPVDPSATDRHETDGVRQDGARFPVGFTTAPLRRASGETTGALVIFQDLTEIETLRRQAEHASRLALLGALAAGLAHEIRNPLGAIAGSVELVRDAEALGAEDRKLLDTVLKETDRLSELVSTMLEVGRAAPAIRERVPIAPILREVGELVRRTGSEVRIELDLTPDEAIEGDVDPQQLRQVLWNLLRNAVQFAPDGSTVRVRARRDEAALEIDVVDEGPGIDEADRDHVFDMFFTRRRHGLGLGLALVKRIIDAHGGTIQALAGAPRGSIFRLRLPDAPERRSSPEPRSPTPRRPAPSRHPT